jgi:hypothetical protein
MVYLLLGLSLVLSLIIINWPSKHPSSCIDLQSTHHQSIYTTDPISCPSQPATDEELRQLVCLASFKQEVGPTLYSLLNTTIKPDVIYVLVPKQVCHYGLVQVDVSPDPAYGTP